MREKESRGVPPFACASLPPQAQGPLSPPPSFLILHVSSYSLSPFPSSFCYRPGLPLSLPQRRASCRHICIFIRECNRRARFSPLVARCRGKNSRKMAERFEVDMRSDFLLHSLSPLYSSPLPTLPHPSVPCCPFSLPPACLPSLQPSPLRNVSSAAADLEETIVGFLRDPELWRSAGG